MFHRLAATRAPRKPLRAVFGFVPMIDQRWPLLKHGAPGSGRSCKTCVPLRRVPRSKRARRPDDAQQCPGCQPGGEPRRCACGGRLDGRTGRCNGVKLAAAGASLRVRLSLIAAIFYWPVHEHRTAFRSRAPAIARMPQPAARRRRGAVSAFRLRWRRAPMPAHPTVQRRRQAPAKPARPAPARHSRRRAPARPARCIPAGRALP